MSAGTARRRSRAEWYVTVAPLHAEGVAIKDIAQLNQVSYSFVSDLLNDPDGAKTARRKERYAGTCLTCGSRTSGHDGPRNAPTICAQCFQEKQSSERKWTPEAVIAQLQTYGRKHGHPPNSQDVLHGRGDISPNVTIVQREFGSWRAGLIAAGFDVPPVGHYVRTEDTKRLMAKRSRAGVEWTCERIVAAIQAWNVIHGRPPTSTDWRTATHLTPSAAVVFRRFGSWNAAIVAAGFVALPQGQRPSYRDQAS